VEPADVRLGHVRVHLHLAQVLGDGEECRRLQRGRHRLPTSTLREMTVPSMGEMMVQYLRLMTAWLREARACSTAPLSASTCAAAAVALDSAVSRSAGRDELPLEELPGALELPLRVLRLGARPRQVPLRGHVVGAGLLDRRLEHRGGRSWR